MPLLFFVRPLIIGYRKKKAQIQGKEYRPLFPKVVKKVGKIKNNIKNRKNGKNI